METFRFFSVALFLAATLAAHAETPAPTHLTTETATNPLGIDSPHPRLSWQLTSTERNTAQTAYELQAAPSAAALAKHPAWDTTRIADSGSINIPYNGPAPASSQRIFWRVRTWDQQNRASAWSEPAFFEMGLLHPADWKAQWIASTAIEDPLSPRPVPLFRTEFKVARPIVSARLYATSLGLYELHLNGRRVGTAQLTPGWTSYNKRLQYQTYDVTALVQQGPNALGAAVADGWYRGQIGPRGRDYYGTQLALLAQLVITFADGATQTIATGNTWKTSTGPILSSEIYNGEIYDARIDNTRWIRPNYNDTLWQPIQVLDSEKAHPKDILVAQAVPPVRATQELKPLAILHSPSGQTIVDMGQNMVGWVRLNVHGPAGTIITLRHAEVLQPNGDLYTTNLRSAQQMVRYTLSGDGDEIYEPHFTYQGFRYVSVEGFPGELTADNITGIVLRADTEPTGAWSTSDGRLNRLQQNIVWSQSGNFVVVPTDCPQRDERLGWTGDAQVFASTATYNFNVDTFLSGWLRDLALDQQTENGEVPAIIPDGRHSKMPHYDGDGHSGWGDAAIIVPWTLYLNYGDRQVLETQYPSMKSWIEWLRAKNPGFLITDLANQPGDWLAYAAASPESRAYPGATTGIDLVATAYYAHVADLMSRTATVLNKPDDARAYSDLFQKIRATWQAEFVSPRGRVGEATQTAYSLALAFNLLPEDLRAEAGKRLAADVARHKDHLTTGFLGTPILNFVLSDSGQLATAYKLLEQTTYPSWLYPITLGATTMWEHWDGLKPDGTFYDPSMNSFNHYAFGAIGDWMYRVVAGIDLDPAEPGYKHILIAPQPGGGLSFVHATHQVPYGEITSNWDLEGDNLHLTVTLPANTHATIKLPGATLATVTESGRPLANATQTGDTVTLETGSGTYNFIYPASPALLATLRPGTPYSIDDTLATLLAQYKPAAFIRTLAPTLFYATNKTLTLRDAAETLTHPIDTKTLTTLDRELNTIHR